MLDWSSFTKDRKALKEKEKNTREELRKWEQAYFVLFEAWQDLLKQTGNSLIYTTFTAKVRNGSYLWKTFIQGDQALQEKLNETFEIKRKCRSKESELCIQSFMVQLAEKLPTRFINPQFPNSLQGRIRLREHMLNGLQDPHVNEGWFWPPYTEPEQTILGDVSALINVSTSGAPPVKENVDASVNPWYYVRERASTPDDDPEMNGNNEWRQKQGILIAAWTSYMKQDWKKFTECISDGSGLLRQLHINSSELEAARRALLPLGICRWVHARFHVGIKEFFIKTSDAMTEQEYCPFRNDTDSKEKARLSILRALKIPLSQWEEFWPQKRMFHASNTPRNIKCGLRNSRKLELFSFENMISWKRRRRIKAASEQRQEHFADIWKEPVVWDYTVGLLCAVFDYFKSKNYYELARLLEEGGHFQLFISYQFPQIERERNRLFSLHNETWEKDVAREDIEKFVGKAGIELGIARFSGQRYSFQEREDFRSSVLNGAGTSLHHDIIWPRNPYLYAEK